MCTRYYKNKISLLIPNFYHAYGKIVKSFSSSIFTHQAAHQAVSVSSWCSRLTNQPLPKSLCFHSSKLLLLIFIRSVLAPIFYYSFLSKQGQFQAFLLFLTQNVKLELYCRKGVYFLLLIQGYVLSYNYLKQLNVTTLSLLNLCQSFPLISNFRHCGLCLSATSLEPHETGYPSSPDPASPGPSLSTQTHQVGLPSPSCGLCLHTSPTPFPPFGSAFRSQFPPHTLKEASRKTSSSLAMLGTQPAEP